MLPPPFIPDDDDEEDEFDELDDYPAVFFGVPPASSTAASQPLQDPGRLLKDPRARRAVEILKENTDTLLDTKQDDSVILTDIQSAANANQSPAGSFLILAATKNTSGADEATLSSAYYQIDATTFGILTGGSGYSADEVTLHMSAAGVFSLKTTVTQAHGVASVNLFPFQTISATSPSPAGISALLVQTDSSASGVTGTAGQPALALRSIYNDGAVSDLFQVSARPVAYGVNNAQYDSSITFSTWRGGGSVASPTYTQFDWLTVATTGGTATVDIQFTWTDTTTGNATTSAHGLMPKGVNDTKKFYRSDATQAIPSGTIIQKVRTDTGTVATGTTGVPIDNTIPQNTEGDQYLSLAITPTSATNRLVIRSVVVVSNSLANWLVASIFQDSTANALKTAAQYQTTATAVIELVVEHEMAAGTTSATTFKVRVGGQSSAPGTTTFNGGGGAGQLFGGVCNSFIEIVEIQS